MRDVKLKYNLIEKQAYALVKDLKYFWVYVLHSKVIDFVPNIVVKDVLLQPDTEGKRCRWIAKVLEFDVHIRPTKLVKGQGLARLMAESNCKAPNLNVDSVDGEIKEGISEYPNIFHYNRYKEIVYFLQNLNFPPEMDK